MTHKLLILCLSIIGTSKTFEPEKPTIEKLSNKQKQYPQYPHTKLTDYFASNKWLIRQDKPDILEFFLQHAILRNDPNNIQSIFDQGARLDIETRAKNPHQLSNYILKTDGDSRHYVNTSHGNIFHRLVLLDNYLIGSNNIASCKLLIKQAIAEEVIKKKCACINTFTLCLFRQREQGKVFLNKDVRNLLRRYIMAMRSDEFLSSADIGHSCKKIVSSLLILLNEKSNVLDSGIGKNKYTPARVLIFSGRYWARHTYSIIDTIQRLWITTPESELMDLISPRKVRATVHRIAQEMYPNLQLSK